MHFSRTLSLFVILILLTTMSLTASFVHSDGPDDLTVPEKQEMRYPKLGSQLDQLVVAVENGQLSPRDAAEHSPVHSGESLGVTIHTSGPTGSLTDFLRGNDADIRNSGPDYIEAYVPVTLLGQTSQQPGVVRIRAIVPPRPVQVTLVEKPKDATGATGGSIFNRLREMVLSILRLLLSTAFSITMDRTGPATPGNH